MVAALSQRGEARIPGKARSLAKAETARKSAAQLARLRFTIVGTGSLANRVESVDKKSPRKPGNSRHLIGNKSDEISGLHGTAI
jgi:hypothetical protein